MPASVELGYAAGIKSARISIVGIDAQCRRRPLASGFWSQNGLRINAVSCRQSVSAETFNRGVTASVVPRVKNVQRSRDIRIKF